MRFQLRRWEGSLIALGSLMWFAILIPWGRFADPDAFYHAHAAALMLVHGPLQAFPWLDLTTFGQQFVDQHFLYHVLILPGIALMEWLRPGDVMAQFWGTQATAPILATLAVMALWVVLKRLDPPRAWIWTVLTLLVSAFSMRMLLAKASPLAVGLFLVAIGTVATSSEESGTRKNSAWRNLIMATVGFLFALSHGGWIISILAVGLMLAGDVLFRWLGRDERLINAIRHATWRELLSLCAGIAAGLLVHPNRDALFQFLWVQVVQIGIFSPADVIPGQEWRSTGPTDIVGTLAPLMIPLLIACWGIAVSFSPHNPQQAVRFRRAILLAFPVALALALTFKSRRFIEYLVPSVALWTASLWALVDDARFKEAVRRMIAAWPRLLGRCAPSAAIALMVFVAWHGTQDAWASMRRDAGKSFDAYHPALATISARATKDDLAANPAVATDRVFHSDWDEFPLLFAADDRLRYVSGLDPVFLYDASSTLSNAVRDLTLGRATSTAWSVIVERTGSRFVFVTTKRHPDFDAALQADPRFHVLYRDETTTAYEAVGE